MAVLLLFSFFCAMHLKDDTSSAAIVVDEYESLTPGSIDIQQCLLVIATCSFHHTGVNVETLCPVAIAPRFAIKCRGLIIVVESEYMFTTLRCAEAAFTGMLNCTCK